MSRLTHRTTGFVAERLRQRMEDEPSARLIDAERRLGRIERTLAYRVRSFRGVRLEVPGVMISPDRDGWLAFSTDTNLEIDRDPNLRGDHAKWKLPSAITDQWCTASITTNVDCDAGSLTADDCGATVTHSSGNGYVAVQISGTANAQTLSYNWCAPSTVGPAMLTGDDWIPKEPTGWLELTVGDECLGGCDAVKVPYWT